MLAKFKRVKDKSYLFQVLAYKTGCDPISMRNNWFHKLFSSVPKHHARITEEILDKMPSHERECEDAIQKIRIKNFGI